MLSSKQVVTSAVRGITRTLCHVHDAELTKVPQTGPFILTTNHVNFLEVPVLYSHLQPRRITTLAKAETWNNPLMGYLFNMAQGIPVHRGEFDITAVRKALAVLQGGDILGIAPEGTRSNHGRLQRGKPGIVLLATKTKAPLLPLVFYGGEQYRRRWTHLRRTDFHIVVGQPFSVRTDPGPVSAETRQQIADEIMYQLAALLPPEYRGVYADLSQATECYLHFEPPATSNLLRTGGVRTGPSTGIAA